MPATRPRCRTDWLDRKLPHTVAEEYALGKRAARELAQAAPDSLKRGLQIACESDQIVLNVEGIAANDLSPSPFFNPARNCEPNH